MTEEAGIKFNNFVPLRDSEVRIHLAKDEETGIESLILQGIAHGYKRNLKNFIITQSASRKAVRKFNDNLKQGRIHQIWIDHAYINPFAEAAPSKNVVGHLTQIKSTDKGLWYEMNLSTEHPSQIHKAILRRDIGGVSIGADVKRKNILCSIDNAPIMSENCDHFVGEKVGEKIVAAVVQDYELDELSVTAKPADPDGTINFSIMTVDSDGKVLSSNIFDKDKLVGESFKNEKKYDRNDSNMTETDINKSSSSTQDSMSAEDVSKMIAEGIATAMQGVESKISQSFEGLNNYVETQKEEKAQLILAEKEGLVTELIQLSEEFTKDELLTFDVSYLKKLKKVLTPKAKINHGTEGQARVGDDFGGSDDSDKFTLSREDKKVWLRMKFGWKPQAPIHIQNRVKARLNGDDDYKGEEFRSYLASKYGDDK